MTQPSLNFVQRVSDHAERLTEAFLNALRDGAWHRGRDLCRQLETDERTIRKIADRSSGRVISSDRGYRLIEFASNAEIDHAEARLLSQARRMTERATEIRKARNNAGRAA